MTDLKTLIEERHSANNFIEGIKIPKEDFEEIFDLLKLAPSCFNIQHANYLVITDENKKEALREAAFNQYKIHTASAAILVLGDKEAYKKVDSIYSGMLNLKMLSKIDYDKMMSDVTNLYEGRGEEFQRDEAIRNASLSAMMFMLIAKDKGWDTCPMIGFDSERVSELFDIPDNLEPVLLITMGKEDTNKRRLRGYRKPIGEFVTFEGFEK
ncbi:nitroreductase family protein [Clostridium sp. C8-1-8]|uniref:nitroreductase family protein n=1 Tax=Clostridium sp. C8-1-8 TaxID=2698831 RepID=UPI001367C358|nr:nitroreductase family protein [Clostridium sp. C8-1-8]